MTKTCAGCQAEFKTGRRARLYCGLPCYHAHRVANAPRPAGHRIKGALFGSTEGTWTREELLAFRAVST